MLLKITITGHTSTHLDLPNHEKRAEEPLRQVSKQAAHADQYR